MKKIKVILFSILVAGNSYSQKIENSKLDSAILEADRIIETDTRVFLKNVESMIVYSQSEIIFEKYYNSFIKDSLHQIQSQTKSIVALLMGIAIDKGYINMSTSFDISNYGYFWWIREMKINTDKTTKVVSAEGAGGQKLYILPEYKLIIAFTERNYNYEKTPDISRIDSNFTYCI